MHVLGHESALSGYTGPGTTWANEKNFVLNHGPGAGRECTIKVLYKNKGSNIQGYQVRRLNIRHQTLFNLKKKITQ